MEDINKQIQELAELSERTNNELQKLGLLEVFKEKVDLILGKEIKQFGTGSAHIVLPSKYLDHLATMIIHKKEEETLK